MKGRITKIKHSGGFIVIASVEQRDVANEKETTFKSSDDPHADLTAAFAGLEPHVRAILGLPPGWAAYQMKITGVSFSWNEEAEVEGAVITAQVALEATDGPLLFNTPHLPFDQYNKDGRAKLMPLEAQDALANLKREAEAFVSGKRAQGNLFEPERRPAGGKMAAAEQVPA